MMQLAVVVAMAVSASSVTGEVHGASSRDMALEFKLGPFTPLIDRASGLNGQPYNDTFGGGPLLLGELELERQFFQRFG